MGTVNKNEEINKCVVCGEPAPSGPQCKMCYYEAKEFKDQIDKNERIQYFNTYYYNLHGNLYRMNNFDKIKSNCNKLIAISMLTKDLFNSETLTKKVFDDIKRVIEKKTPKEDQKSTSQTKQQDSQQEKLISTQDGHLVKSRGEAEIDNMLYLREIVHSYSPTVDEIDNDEEQSIEADWFIPIAGINKGVYIEYWGMNTKAYNDNKKRKIAQYEKNKIPYISIQKEEPFEDVNALKRNLFKAIQQKAKEYYNIDWKKNI